MGTTPLHIGLIGFGRIAELVHLRILSGIPGVHVAAVAEQDGGRRKQVWSRAPQAGTFDDYHAMLHDAELDAVVICLPPAQHGAAAIAAFEAGKHVYLEKPITPTLDEAKAVLTAWRTSGKIGMIGFNFRFHPLFQQAKRVIQSGQYGAVIGARSVFTTPTRQLPTWKERRATGGGILLDLASHHIDIVHDLFGESVVSVSALEHSQRVEADNAALTLKLESGAVVSSLFSMNSISENRFEIYLEKAKLVADFAAPDALDIYESTVYLKRGQRVQRAFRTLSLQNLRRAAGYEPSFGLALSAFAQALRSGSLIRPDLEDGYRSLQVVVAAEEAARTDKPVLLNAPVPAPHILPVS